MSRARHLVSLTGTASVSGIRCVLPYGRDQGSDEPTAISSGIKNLTSHIAR